MAAIKAPKAPLASFTPCQRCGLPHSLPSGLELPALLLSLPFLSLCSACRGAAQALATAAAAAPPAQRRAAALCALSALSSTAWHGEGLLRRTALRAAMAVGWGLLGGVGGATVGAVTGALGGLLGGGLMGGLGGGVLGFDAGNCGSSGSGSGKGGPAPAASAAATPSAPPSSSAASGAAPAAAAAAAALPEASMRSRAIARMGDEERAADAVAEAARMAAAPTAYAVLGLPAAASLDAIKRAHKALSLAYHPDRNSAPAAPEVAAKVNAAYAILSDEDKRAAYDEALAAGSTEGAAQSAAAGGGEGGAGSAMPALRIRRSALGVVGGGVGGVVGMVLGASLGAVTGTLTGIVSGARTQIRAAAASSGVAEGARASVQRLCSEAAARIAAAAAAAPPAQEGGQEALFDISTTGAHYATGDVAIRVRAGSSVCAWTLPALQPGRLPDMPALLDLTLRPSQCVIARVAACTGGGSEEEVAFGTALASAAAAFTACVRKEAHIPEPAEAWDGGGEGDGSGSGSSAAAGGGDATGMHGGDTFEDAQARLAAAAPGGGKAIKTAAGLVGMAFSSVGQGIAKVDAEQRLRQLQVLGCVWEARSRGREESPEWVVGRLKALSAGAGGGEAEVGAIESPDGDQSWAEVGGPAGGGAEAAAAAASAAAASAAAARGGSFPELLVWAKAGAGAAAPAVTAPKSSGGKAAAEDESSWALLGPLNFSRAREGGACAMGPANFTLPRAVLASASSVLVRITAGGLGAADKRELVLAEQLLVL